MCHYQTLYHDDSLGYAVRCNECEKIQLGYGNMVITFSQEDFDAFRSWLVRIRDEQDPAISSGLRCILIPTPCEGMKLLLSKRELDEFVVMLETADNELQSLALLKLFSVD
ncbi:MAG: hypothetical protein EOO05_19180 [Chitinophagaceae bacterium]|nr:MAG: hypothetical protein EOO05_19180 [Chitinophagaceae bacterium]